MTYFDLAKPTGPRRPVAHNFSPPPKKRFRRIKWLVFLAILIIIAGWGVSLLFSKTNQIFTTQQNIFTRIGNLIISPDKHLIGEDEGMINILLMGVGGVGHDGAHLTDTMVVAQINTKTSEVVLTSIPRDWGLVLPNVGYNKINAAYAYAYRDNPHTAGDAAIAAIERVTGLEIPYFAVIDFRGFVRAVDNVGGVDVIVDQTFTDATFPNDYPNDTRGYLAPITFTKGPAHMDGRTALIFARSRHSGNNNEGSDFARSERQKKIITGFKERVASLNITNLSTINNLLSDFTENFRTNLEPYELKRLADLGVDIKNENIYSFSLEPDGVLICSSLVDPATGRPAPRPVVPDPAETKEPIPAGGETEATTEPTLNIIYVVIPCADKTLADIHDFIIKAPILAKLRTEGAVVEIQNSVGKTGLANQLFGNLADFGVTVKFTTFKGKVPYEQTLLYDNSHAGKPHTIDYIKNNYNLTISDVNYPASSADFVIVVGKDQL